MQEVLNQIQKVSEGTLVDYLGIVFTAVTGDSLTGELTLTQNHTQPAKIMHGAVSCVLAETLGSVASNILIDREQFQAVGQVLNTNHLRPAMPGEKISGTAKLVHHGKKTHVWEIPIVNEQGKTISLNRLTMAIIPKKA